MKAYTKRQIYSLFSLILFTVSVNVYSEPLRFKYSTGDKYRILSTVNESVYFDGNFNNQSEIINRISVEVTDVKTASEEPDAEIVSGTHRAVFVTSEKASINGKTEVFSWGEEYESIFDRDIYGFYDIGDEYFMPVVRDVPVFPAESIEKGDSWQCDGEEAHDMRHVYGIEKPFKIPFTATYTYKDDTVIDGKKLQVITAEYSIDYKVPDAAVKSANYETEPHAVMGFSHETIYWDNEAGTIDSYNETFRILIETKAGHKIEYRGTARAEYAKSAIKDKAALIEQMKSRIEQLEIENTLLKEDTDGITLCLENIQFKANSAELLPGEKEKLSKIADILKDFNANDLLISGHTARFGTEETCQTLSEQRAAAVAEYLIKLGVKDAYHIFTRGFGSRMPAADNITEEGKAKNRRVEITIMD